MNNISLQVITEKDVILSNLEFQLIEIETDYKVEKRTLQLVDGVTVDLFGDSEAVLRIGNSEVEFSLNSETAQMLTEWDTFESLEFLDVLYRNRLDRSDRQ